MAQRKTAQLKPKPNPNGDAPAEEYVPSWQKSSVDRSLRNARARAQKRSDRFVEAAVELLSERDESDFTVQDVVDRANMSQRTFYTFFDGKDSLMLAVYETILRTTALPLLRERCEGIADPVQRLRTLIEVLSEITAMPAPLTRGLSVLHLRLAETRPIDLAYALEPLHELIVELLTGVEKAGLLREDVGLATQAALLQELLVASVHSAVLAGGRQATSVDDMWAFCSAAILRRG
jgi:AcrR family transcriptional regulator